MNAWLALPTPTQSQMGGDAFLFLVLFCLLALAAGLRK